MKEVIATSDLAEIALLKSLFQDAGIPVFMFDEHLSGVLGGFGDDFAPCRVMVADSDYDAACDLVDEFLDIVEGEE